MPKFAGPTIHRGDHILGKPRAQWVDDAARALINSTTPGGRYKLVTEGFLKFQTFAMTAFDNEAGLKFTSDELRRIFYVIESYLTLEFKKNPKLKRGMKKLLAQDRKVM